MNFKLMQEAMYKKFAEGYKLVWNHRLGRYDWVRAIEERHGIK